MTVYLATPTSPLRSRGARPGWRLHSSQSTGPVAALVTTPVGRKHERRTTWRDRDPDARFSEKRSCPRPGAGRGGDLDAGGAAPARPFTRKHASRPREAALQFVAKHKPASTFSLEQSDRQLTASASRRMGPQLTIPAYAHLANCASLAIPRERPVVASKRGPGGARGGASACPRHKKSRAFGPTVTTTSGPPAWRDPLVATSGAGPI